MVRIKACDSNVDQMYTVDISSLFIGLTLWKIDQDLESIFQFHWIPIYTVEYSLG